MPILNRPSRDGTIGAPVFQEGRIRSVCRNPDLQPPGRAGWKSFRSAYRRSGKSSGAYVGKTRYVHGLASGGKCYFLSRPRRFGKSLLLSTFEALFGPAQPPGGLSRRELFADLWIGGSDYDFGRECPVATISLSGEAGSPDALRILLSSRLNDINGQEGLGLELTPGRPDLDLPRIIARLSEARGSRVVVLIDEYDAPVSDNAGDPVTAQGNYRVLKAFYSGFKGTDRFLRFVFTTGVTRYAFTGLTTGLNRLSDLTHNGDYAGICGFVPEELESVFGDHMADHAGLGDTGARAVQAVPGRRSRTAGGRALAGLPGCRPSPARLPGKPSPPGRNRTRRARAPPRPPGRAL
jgi:hypothetical protein